MIAYFGRDARQTARLCGASPPGTAVLVADDWQAFERIAAGAECAVVWLEWLGAGDGFSRLVELRARLPLQPMVLVTHKDADNARHLKDVLLEEVVWHDEPAHELWSAVARARARGTLSLVALAFQRAPRLAPPLRRGLVFACRSSRPIHSVSRLSDMAGCDRRTLWRHWRDAVGDEAPLTLQDVVDWLLLLRAAQRKTIDVCWRAVAEEMGVHEHTIGRLAQRLGHHTLRGLSGMRLEGLLDRFDAEVMALLADDGAAGRGDRPSRGRRAAVRPAVGEG